MTCDRSAPAGTPLPVELETAVNDLAPRLYRFCLGRTGSPEAAEEAAQEALAALVSRWRRHGPPDSPEAFAFTVARRRAVRAALRRRLLRPLAALVEPGGEPEAEGPGVEERAAARAELVRTAAALRRLPPRDREALLLAAAGELGTAEAARILGIGPSAYKMRLHRARRRLHELLERPDERTLEATERA
jgi:RNA polymerase sigma-70 factor, ECF subfamily